MTPPGGHGAWKWNKSIQVHHPPAMKCLAKIRVIYIIFSLNIDHAVWYHISSPVNYGNKQWPESPGFGYPIGRLGLCWCPRSKAWLRISWAETKVKINGGCSMHEIEGGEYSGNIWIFS